MHELDAGKGVWFVKVLFQSPNMPFVGAVYRTEAE